LISQALCEKGLEAGCLLRLLGCLGVALALLGLRLARTEVAVYNPLLANVDGAVVDGACEEGVAGSFGFIQDRSKCLSYLRTTFAVLYLGGREHVLPGRTERGHDLGLLRIGGQVPPRDLEDSPLGAL
jgi:hypothetical protein